MRREDGIARDGSPRAVLAPGQLSLEDVGAVAAKPQVRPPVALLPLPHRSSLGCRREGQPLGAGLAVEVDGTESPFEFIEVGIVVGIE